MKIIETREFFESYRGTKEYFPGEILAKKFKIEYLVLVPGKSSPTDEYIFKYKHIDKLISKKSNIENYKIKSLFSLRIKGSFPAVELAPFLLYDILKERPDLLIDVPYTTFTPRTYFSFIASRILSIPILFINSGDLSSKKDIVRRLLIPVESYMYKRSIIISINEISKKKLIHEYSLENDSIYVIPKAVDISKFNSSSFKKCSLNLCSDRKIILYVGRIDKKKGLQSLIDSANLLGEIDILIAGNGPDLEFYKKECEIHHICNIKFLGHIPNQEIMKLYAQADIVVIPDMTNPVGFSTVLAESMSMGKAIIIGNRGFEDATPIMHMKTGIIVRPNCVEDIVYFAKLLIDRKDISENLAKNAFQYAKDNMDLHIVAGKYYDIISNLIDISAKNE